ncbi:MAG: hypothetical protein H0U60_12350 [Blastocatellia bacterium]|nr:hypothetical protein [Blastocatellia bacterium]
MTEEQEPTVEYVRWGNHTFKITRSGDLSPIHGVVLDTRQGTLTLPPREPESGKESRSA